MNYVKCDCGYTFDKDVHKACPSCEKHPPDFEATEKVTLPKLLRRKSDGKTFSQNLDGTYSVETLKKQFPESMHMKWTYECLFSGSNLGCFEEVEYKNPPDNQLDSEELKSTHCCKVTLVDVDTTEEGIMNPEFPLKGWRRYRIEYGGCNEDTLVEGIIYLPSRADPQAIVDQIMGMQAHEQIWTTVK